MPDPNPRDSFWFARRLPHPDVLKAVLDGDPVEQLLGVARSRAIVIGGDDLMPKKSAEEEQVAAMLATAAEAAKRLALDPASPLSDQEKDALDLFTLLLARPAFLVQKGTIAERPENWPEITHEKEMLPDVIAGVGRIELANHFKIGTGFIVGDKRILTNNHVVCSLVGMPHPRAWKLDRKAFDEAVDAHNETWAEDEDARPWFDVCGEFNAKEPSPARVKKILGSHKDVDMAVLELDAVPKNAQRLPLATAEPPQFEGRHIYVVGHPIKDTGATLAPIPILRRIFGQDETLGMKRLSPGAVMDWENEREFHHDASTLAGSSGSCIVDFKDHRVVGLHFRGFYEKRNHAIPLWKFQEDVLLTSNGVIF